MNWRFRYQQQTLWTQNVRNYLWQKIPLRPESRVLEVGCGWGAVMESLPFRPALLAGVDLNLEPLRQAAADQPGAFCAADAFSLPFAPHTFDIVFCHYLLLWLDDPAAALAQMARITRPGGAVLALAEPDYAARIEYPPALEKLGGWQSACLEKQGVNLRMGRSLPAAFARAGLRLIETGIHAGGWDILPEGTESEWAVYQADLAGKIPPALLAEMRLLDETARRRAERVSFVPTFYAWAAV